MVTCLAFSPRGAILATGSLDTTVKLWETATGRERASLDGHTDGVSALAFATERPADGHRRGSTATVRLWEPATPIFSPAACLAYPGEARSLDFSPDGRSLRAAGAAGTARWDAMTGSRWRRPCKDDATAVRHGRRRHDLRDGRAGRQGPTVRFGHRSRARHVRGTHGRGAHGRLLGRPAGSLRLGRPGRHRVLLGLSRRGDALGSLPPLGAARHLRAVFAGRPGARRLDRR